MRRRPAVALTKPSARPPACVTRATNASLASPIFVADLSPVSAKSSRMPFNAFAKILSRVKIEIVKRSDQAKGFVTLPKRWIVERTIAWLNRCRRPAKDCRVRGRRLGCIGHPKVRITRVRLLFDWLAARLTDYARERPPRSGPLDA